MYIICTFGCFILSKPTDYVMHKQFNNCKLCHTVFMCFVQGDQREPDIFKINSTQLFFK